MLNNTENKKIPSIGIIDPVGQKAGMDSYDIPLANGLVENGCSVFIYSNFDACVRNFTVDNVFSTDNFNTVNGAMQYFMSLLKACLRHRRNYGDWIILHYFNSNILTLLSFTVPRLFGFKVIGIIHDVDSFGGDDSNLFRDFILNRLSNLICVQNPIIKKQVKSLVHFGNDKIFEAAHGDYESIKNTNENRSEIKRKFGINGDKVVVLFFGQIKKVKGLEIFLEAACQADDRYHFIVAGKPWKDSLDRYSHLLTQLQSRDNVTLDLQYISNDARHDIFDVSDVLVLPYHEIFESGVMHMGMSFALPIVASDLPLFSERIKESNGGLCFERGNPKDLIEKLNVLAEDRDLMKELGRNSKKYSEINFNWGNIAQKYIHAIDGQK